MNIQDWFPLGSLYSLLQFIPQHKQDFFHSKIILNSIWKGSGPKRTKTIMPKKEREWTCGRKYSVSAAAAKSLQLCLTLCDPIDGSPPGSSVHGILQARILEWVAIPFSRGCSQPRGWTQVSCIAGIFFTPEPPGSLILCVFYHNFKTVLSALK